MTGPDLHTTNAITKWPDWDGSTAKARQLQEQLRAHINLSPLKRRPKTIGGADISFNVRQQQVYAAIVVLQLDNFAILEESGIIDQVSFPYIPGFLSFREVPPLLKAWNKLTTKPEVLMLDGHGIMHPRSMGVATHFGLCAKVPTLGCAKKRLIGEFQPPDQEKGSSSPLYYQGELRGYVYRSRSNVKPVFISPGNGMSIENALELARLTTGRLRMLEPTRLAHHLANRLRKNLIA